MTHAYVLLINKIRLIGILRNQKKTRKNSAPKVMLTSTFSPDGANNVFLKYFNEDGPEPVPLAKPIKSNNWSNEFGGFLKYLFCCVEILSKEENATK